MRIFLSYRYTGEDPAQVESILGNICASLQEAGHEPYCFFLANKGKNLHFTSKQIIEEAFREIDKAELVLVYIKSPEKSEGMILEVGYSLARGKRFMVASLKGVTTTYMHGLAERVIEFSDVEDLYSKLRNLKID